MFDPARKHPYPDALRPDEAPAPHALLAPLVGLVGTWVGRGRGEYPTLAEEFEYAQEISFRHDGRPFLQYESRAWLLDADGAPLRPSARESGWWRLQPEGRVEALIIQPTGIAEILVGGGGGRAGGPNTHQVGGTAPAKTGRATPRPANHTPHV
ncbi:FABP family protein, partial [Streptomyces sp. NPDC005485]|uniref:FABP family protein n=1 Tax=Streptomyces sp. NPDC005485 TaxID=3155591 RepID=UPI0033B6BCB2